MTMTLVSTITVGAGGQAAIEFTSIPQTADDLVVLLSARSTNTGTLDSVSLTFNNNATTSNYQQKGLRGDGSAAASYQYNNVRPDILIINAVPDASATTSTFGNQQIYIPKYTSTSSKSISIDSVAENNATLGNQQIVAGVFNQAAGITSLKFTCGVNFAQYSTASLYTITKGSGGATVS